MSVKEHVLQKAQPYIQALPKFFNYQIVTKAILSVWLFLLGRIFNILLKSSGRVAVTSGDWKFLFTTWQGLLILILGIVSLYLYIAFDLNAKIALCGNLLTGEKASFKDCIRKGFDAVKRLTNLRGILVALYIALIAPILGVGVSISMTEGLYIPTFISSVIRDSVLYSALAGVVVLVFLSVGIANLFILHGIVIDDLPINEAGDLSRKLIKANWKDYLKQNAVFLLSIAASLALIGVVFLFLPLKLISVLPQSAVSRLLTIFFVLAGTAVSVMADLFGMPLYLLKMTQLYFSYTSGEEYEFSITKGEKKSFNKKTAAIAAIAAAALVLLMYANFDRWFPANTNVKIIAHRAGGNEGRENTLSGLETAWLAGASGSEIDIQRTKDGRYVLNHDGTFKRVAGVNKKPEEMTLNEVKKLSVDGERVPTYDEMLISAKGRMVLFTELKGKTADKRMADDAVRLVKQNKMEDGCVMISLKYDLIDYIETNYPEIDTGFLTFASFGKTAELNCDFIGLEEESATVDAIDSIHKEGKKALVWTVNSEESQRHFLCTKADGIITDNVSQAMKLASQLETRSDVDRMVDKIKTLF